MADLIERISKEIIMQKEGQNNILEDLDLEGFEVGQFTSELQTLLQKQQQVTTLSLVECGLTNLQNFPNFTKLENLILESNKLDASAVKYIADHFKNIKCLSLAENNINTLQELEPLKALHELKQLDLSDNPVSKVQGYSNAVFELLPDLQILDNKDKNGKEVEYSDEEDPESDEDDIDDDEDEDFGGDDDDNDDDEEQSDEEDKKRKRTKK